MRIVYGYVEGDSLNQHQESLSDLGVIKTKTLGVVDGGRLAFAALLLDVASHTLPLSFDSGVLVDVQNQRLNTITSTPSLFSANATKKHFRKSKNQYINPKNWRQFVSRNRALQCVSRDLSSAFSMEDIQ
ncbi:hypothetical protein [Vibrio chagasii]|uniref:hypothetical protein n=1 Tax=Vibrio chagasii TaxID=170679 RepID=UPI002283A7E6|nr:hypothetical protein [Vibrio chagasii]MCY9828844.1 hypothetical protein [Vibrio chagasii]